MAESIASHSVTMASKEKQKKNGTKKNASKTVESGSESLRIGEQSQDLTVVTKLDQLLEVVKGLDTEIQEQDVRLQKQEERVSLCDVSALLSAQSSPKADKDLQPEKLSSFQELKGDSKIQADVYKPTRIHLGQSLMVSRILLLSQVVIEQV